LNGGAYFSFQGFSADHMRHHSEQIDFADVENSQLFGMLPRYVQLGIFRLELIYLPAAYLLIKGYGLAAGIRSGGVPAMRIMIVLCAYLLFYFVLFLVSPMALLLFFVAVVLRIHCVRFVDAFQHTYEQVSPDGPKRPKDKVYEQRNTFSFPVARRWKPLNLLIMNFGFHNAHHAVMTCPWYNLSKLDEVLFSATQSGTSPAGHAYDRHDVSFWELLHRYHLDRISRITADNAGTAYDAEAEMAFSMRNFRGALTDNLLG
jgi:fatty acid desaturase